MSYTCPWAVHNFANGACRHQDCPAHVTATTHSSGCLYALFGGRTDLTNVDLAFGLNLRPIDLREQLASEQAAFQNLVWLVNQTEECGACNVAWNERQINLNIAEEVLQQFPFAQVVVTAERLHQLVEYCAQKQELSKLYKLFPQLQRLRDYHGLGQNSSNQLKTSTRPHRSRLMGAKHQ